ncbi:MAG: LuxR C-terminal-related transcriptional regulator, partial [Dehalococcoidales bacterium]|nr:LuxR C-terminal-related transcriptional regulator [Dehalococcoidales bacterium]
ILTQIFENWAAKLAWEGRVSQLIERAARRPFLFWFLLLGVFIALEASILPDSVKLVSAKVVTSLFILSLAWIAIAMSEELLELYLPKMKVPRSAVDLALSFVVIALLAASVLIALAIWGVPTTPFLLLIAVVTLLGLFATRNVAPNAFAAVHMWNTEHVKAGDYIRLETGEEGYVTEINWNSTHIKTLNETTVIIPNSRLIQSKFVNYGQAERVTRELFTFNGRLQERDFPFLNRGTAVGAGGVKVDEIKSILSDREKDIARLISEGVGNREIGERLFIAENTVKVHVKNILKKLELRNRQQLAAYAALRNWTTSGEGKKQDDH